MGIDYEKCDLCDAVEPDCGNNYPDSLMLAGKEQTICNSCYEDLLKDGDYVAQPKYKRELESAVYILGFSADEDEKNIRSWKIIHEAMDIPRVINHCAALKDTNKFVFLHCFVLELKTYVEKNEGNHSLQSLSHLAVKTIVAPLGTAWDKIFEEIHDKNRRVENFESIEPASPYADAIQLMTKIDKMEKEMENPCIWNSNAIIFQSFTLESHIAQCLRFYEDGKLLQIVPLILSYLKGSFLWKTPSRIALDSNSKLPAFESHPLKKLFSTSKRLMDAWCDDEREWKRRKFEPVKEMEAKIKEIEDGQINISSKVIYDEK